MLAVTSGEREAAGIQGRSDPNLELLDAAAQCRRLVREASVEAFLADHRQELIGIAQRELNRGFTEAESRQYLRLASCLET